MVPLMTAVILCHYKGVHLSYVHREISEYIDTSNDKPFLQAINQGSLNIVKRLVFNFNYRSYCPRNADEIDNIVPLSSYLGQYEIMIWALNNGFQENHTAIEQALAGHNCTQQEEKKNCIQIHRDQHIKIIKWLFSNNYSYSSECLDSCANPACLHILKYLYSHSIKRCSYKAINIAIQKGFFGVAKFLMSTSDALCSSSAMLSAIHYNNMELVKNLWTTFAFSMQDSGYFLYLAVCNDFVLAVKLFLKFASHSDKDIALTQAIETKAYFPKVTSIIFKTVFEHVGSCSFDVMDLAAKHGFLDIVTYLHDHGQKCSADAIDMAALKGHKELVQFLLEKSSPQFTYKALENAASRGHLSIVKLLYNNGAETHDIEEMIILAAVSTNMPLVHYIIQRYMKIYPFAKINFSNVPSELSISIIDCVRVSQIDCDARNHMLQYLEMYADDARTTLHRVDNQS